jgi:hypothetical protein
MKKILCTRIQALLLAVALGSGAAYGVPITGSIGFTGPYTANNSDLTLATTLTFGTVEVTGVHDGAFSGIATGTVATTPASLTVNQPGVVLPAGAIWSVGGFALTLSAIVETFNSANTLNLEGIGTITGPAGFDPTPGIWVGTFNVAGTNFTFSASSSSTASPVPEGGTSLALLGIGLIAVGLVYRRFSPVRG